MPKRKNKVRWKGHSRVRNFNGKKFTLAFIDAPNTKVSKKEISETLGYSVNVRTTQGKFDNYRVTNIWVKES